MKRKGRIKLTIGLCVKNAEATIEDALDSILNQSFPHELMELIVVDGFSKDRTLDIIKNKLKDSKIKTKIFRERKGLGHARQIVVDNAEGDYIIWVDADMILSRDFVEKQVSFMENNAKVGIAKGRYGMLKESSLVATLEDVEFFLSFRNEGEVNSTPLGTSGCIYRVEAVKQVGGFDPNIEGAGEDIDIENRIRSAGWLLYVASAIFYEKRRNSWRSLWNEYFWHGRGVVHSFKKNRRVINIYKMMPPVALLMELLRVPTAYRLTRNMAVLLLPLHYLFKRIAWFFGFLKDSFK